MRKYSFVFLSFMWLTAMPGSVLAAQECIECHLEVTPRIVSDWQLSKHNQDEEGPNCIECHGSAHKSAEDVNKVLLATPSTCASCHEERVDQFKEGKHSKAWVAMNAMPTAHWQPMALMDGMKGCGGCHKIGIKSEEEVKKLKEKGQEFGNASCDACHTRHLFSAEEARQPQTCRTCHMGIDHPQWEMYSSSKHGVRYKLKQLKVLPEGSSAPTCQTCHLPDGNHAVRTAWGFLAVRLPMPADKQWASDRATFLKGLGVLDPEGKPTGRLDVVKGGDVARLTQADWEKEREKMLKTCNSCHSGNFARLELEKGDQMIREADRLMAEGITVVAELYRKGLIDKPDNYVYPFPDLLTFHDAPTEIEQKLFLMFLKYRMRTFQGIFHANPDYAFWYGWSEMKMTLTEIKRLAAEMNAGPGSDLGR